MTQSRFDHLVALLKELFQLDKPDLDFGFYRIMHAKADEVTQFLERDLLPKVKKAFSQYESADRAVNARSLEADIYDDLYRFFRRYYSKGDFLSKRVYKDDVYAIPYQGEEVKLHWANSDQYYIKTTEHLRDYSFRLHPDDADDPMRVHFRLVDAIEGEHGNVKARDEKTSRFILAEHDFMAMEEGEGGIQELAIHFVYRPATASDLVDGQRLPKTGAPTQKVLTDAATKRILAAAETGFDRWNDSLVATHVKADGTRADYSRLRAHLDRYTARNTYDYFIHKDLGTFLRRELDFYIKNEMMHLDDIEDADAPRVEEWLSKIKVIRSIAHTIIDFLAQLENFQKKLWLKKKFVVDTSYCITLRTIPEEFYEEIAANRAQHDEWVNLLAIDEIEGDLARSGYSWPLNVDFLKAHPTLMVDTHNFGEDFTAQLLEAMGNIDEQTDGVLFHSENFQALRLMQRRYAGRVDCVYIDPPYNAPKSEIAYKNDYKHSSFLSLIEGRLRVSRNLVTADGSHVIAIDKHESNNVIPLLDIVFPANDNVVVTVEHNRRGVQGDHFSYTHEYALFSVPMARKELNLTSRQAADWEWSQFRNWGGESLRTDGANCFYAILVRDETICGFGDVWTDDSKHPEGANVVGGDGITEVYPIDAKGVERKWRYARDTVEGIRDRLRVGTERNGTLKVEIAKTTDQFKTVWYSPLYNAGDNGTKVCRQMGLPIGEFDYPKSVFTVRDCIFAVSDARSVVLDYFAGSGTTAHAVMALNRKKEDGGRKFILVEMADYFDTVLLPRIKKVTFTPQWKDQRPERVATRMEAKRSPRIIKVVRLESYEDTLNNLLIQRTEEQKHLLDSDEMEESGFKEEYLMRYMLDVETRGSASLLNIGKFSDPSTYLLKVKRPGSDESREVTVDLVETFNWLVGLRTSLMGQPRRYSATLHRDGEGRLVTQAEPVETPEGEWWFQAIEGVLPDDRRALIVWRNRPRGDEADGVEQDNAVLNSWFTASGYAGRHSRFDIVYVNGDHNLAALEPMERTWTAHVIEDHFKQLMFEGDHGGELW